MPNQIASKKSKATGFTLIELMITVAIVALLASIALPAYNSSIRKSRRTEAKNALLDLAGREESLYATKNTYSSTATDLGYSGLTPVGHGYYNVAITIPTTAPINTFTITATPIGDQLKDTSCNSFTIKETGAQSSFDSSAADSTATCWK